MITNIYPDLFAFIQNYTICNNDIIALRNTCKQFSDRNPTGYTGYTSRIILRKKVPIKHLPIQYSYENIIYPTHISLSTNDELNRSMGWPVKKSTIGVLKNELWHSTDDRWEMLKEVTTVSFYGQFNEIVPSRWWPPKTLTVHFRNYTKSIAGLPASITNIYLHAYRGYFDYLPRSLHELNIENHPLNVNIILPKSLKHLRLTGWYHSMSWFPENLESLILPETEINIPMCDLPKNLVKLEFRTTLPILRDFPNDLKSLIIRNTVTGGTVIENLPKGLTSLRLDGKFSNQIPFPESLTSLSLCKEYRHSLENLPVNLTELTYGGLPEFYTDFKRYPLKTLDLYSQYTFNIPDFDIKYAPMTLKILSLSDTYPYNLRNLPCSLETLNIGSTTFKFIGKYGVEEYVDGLANFVHKYNKR